MAQAAVGTRRNRGHKGLIALGVVLLLIILLILLWSWDWFIPLVERQASATLGRKVTIEHLHVRLGRRTRIVVDGVQVAGTDEFPRPLATIDHLTLVVEALPLIRHFQIVLPLIGVDHPEILALAKPDGTNNWTLGSGKSSTPTRTSTASEPKLGVLEITNGHVHVVDPKLKANFDVTVATRNAVDAGGQPIQSGQGQPGQSQSDQNRSDQGQIVADAKGTYAQQPVTARFIGGAILSLRDKTRPYPVDLRIANGPTRVSLVGTIEQPLSFGGARLKLLFTGPDMSLLFPLTGVPIPQTPPYRLSGNLDYARQRIEFRDFEGRVGSSDLNGTITVLPAHVPTVDATLFSHNVDLADLGGFIGSSPGRKTTPGSTPAQKADVSRANNDGNVLPTNSFNLPKIRAANVHLSYKGTHIENRDLPLDNIVARLDIQDGVIDLRQLDFAVGTGTIFSSASLDPAGNTLQTKAHVDFHKIDVSRVMQATHVFHGQGIFGGRADLTTSGNSLAEMLGNGNGGLSLVMTGGGDVSALLPDIAGLELGNALLSALGVPNRSKVQCFVADLPLKDGILSTRALLLQTTEARSVGQGTINFKQQTLDYSLTTRSSHFSVGSLPGPVDITGKLGKPSILPGKEILARAGVATGLGFVLPPLALLPTIQFGVGETGACQAALTDIRTDPTPVVHPQKHRTH